MPSSTYPAKPEQAVQSTLGKALYPKSPESRSRQEILSQKIKFQSQDSEGSDISYQSSLQSDDQMQLNRIDYFKEEMARFFINYPELINEDLIGRDIERENCQEQEKGDIQENAIGSRRQQTNPGNQKNTNHPPIALEVLKQTKDSFTSLQSLAKRITIYKSKTQEPDLIDILIKQQSSILKEIESDLNLRKFQNTDKHLNANINNAEGISCQNQNIVAGNAVGDTVYYSWKKRREMETKKSYSGHLQGEDHSKRKDCLKDNRQKERKLHVSVGLKIGGVKTVQKFHSLQKNSIRSLHSRNPNINTNTLESKPQKQPGGMKKQKKSQSNQHNQDGKNQARKSQDLKNSQFLLTKPQDPNSKLANPSNTGSFGLKNSLGTVTNMKDLQQHKNVATSSLPHNLVFQPKTQVGKQLLQQIKKFSANDQLNIKKTIINFVSKHRKSLEKDNANKNTLSQKINKQFSEDSKELVMYYPGKHGDNTVQMALHGFQYNKQSTGGEIINPNSTYNNNHITSEKDGKSSPQSNSNKNVSYGNNNTGFMNSNGTMSGNYTGSGTFNKNSINNISGNSTNNQGTSLPTETDSLLQVLKEISEGPLMKYWKMLQEKKL